MVGGGITSSGQQGLGVPLTSSAQPQYRASYQRPSYGMGYQRPSYSMGYGMQQSPYGMYAKGGIADLGEK